MKTFRFAAACAALMTAPTLDAQESLRYRAALAGHALLPAETLIAAPADAPEALRTSGKFTEPGHPARLAAPPMKGEAPPFLGQPVRKLAHLDLVDIEDPRRTRAAGAARGWPLHFPFVTIENVDRADDTHIIVGNDNNFPYSSGRSLGARDDNELILLEVGALLAAKSAQ
jgi:hypothetical protein